MSSLHIIAGTFKGRPLKTPKGGKTRPTTALVRKAVFDIAAPLMEGASFLDLFAGSGAMGLEALSRGAAHATFVENGKEALRAIAENIASFDVEKFSTIVRADVVKALSLLQRQGKAFDCIYCDPPYHLASELSSILELLDQSPLLNKGGMLFLEEGAPSKLHPGKLSRLIFRETRRFGKAAVHIFYSR